MYSKGQLIKLSLASDHYPGEMVWVIDTAPGEEFDVCVSPEKYGVQVEKVQWIKADWIIFSNTPTNEDAPKRRGRKPGTQKTKPTAAPVAMDPVIETTPASETVFNVPITRIVYPFPLDHEQRASLSLPSPLTKRDADRLCQLINALVMESEVDAKP